MNNKKIIIAVLLLVVCCGTIHQLVLKNIYDAKGSKYTITYQLKGGEPYTLPVSEHFVVGNSPIKSENEMTNRKYSIYTQNNITSTSVAGDNLYLNCHNDICKSYEDVLHESSYSQELFLTRLGNFDIRLYPNGKGDSSTEILNIETGKTVVYDGLSYQMKGITLENSIIVESARGSKIELLEIDPESMSVINNINLSDINNGTKSIYYTPVNVEGELYFFVGQEKMLKKLDLKTNTMVDSNIKNPLPIYDDKDTTLNFTELSSNDKSYYIIESDFNNVYITDFENYVKLDSSEKILYSVYSNVYDDEKDEFLLMTSYVYKGTPVCAFISFDPKTFETETLSNQEIDNNISIRPTLSKNY